MAELALLVEAERLLAPEDALNLVNQTFAGSFIKPRLHRNLPASPAGRTLPLDLPSGHPRLQ